MRWYSNKPQGFVIQFDLISVNCMSFWFTFSSFVAYFYNFLASYNGDHTTFAYSNLDRTTVLYRLT